VPLEIIAKHKVMKKISSQMIGLRDNSDGYSIEELLAAFSEQQYHRLIGFARLRLRAVANSRWLQQCLAVTDAEDLVHQAIFKLHLGEREPALGRHLKARNRVNMEAFLACVKGVISSDLYNLVNAARHRHEHTFIGNPEQEAGAVEPTELQDTDDLLSRRDLHRVFFKKLYQRIENQPALLAVVQDWEQCFWDDDRIGSSGFNRDLVYRVRQLAREIIVDFGELWPTISDGKEMLL
jgi:hypothetical protein